jgi:hypothetical protein
VILVRIAIARLAAASVYAERGALATAPSRRSSPGARSAPPWAHRRRAGPLHGGGDHVISLKTPAQARDVAGALKGVTRDGLRCGYDAIDPASYQGKLCEEDFDYTWSWLTGLVAFHERAAAQGHRVIFTVDQQLVRG